MDRKSEVLDRVYGISSETEKAVELQPDADHEVYAGETYYGVPPVKHSIYRWTIAISYFSIGLAGASQMLCPFIEYSDLPQKERMLRAGRYAALAGSVLTPILYTKELGTPRKWYNMLRIFRSTSLMSVGGGWMLTAFGSLSGGTALGQLLQDTGSPKSGAIVARSFGLPAALLGSFMSMYMGTELEETSTPLWAESSPLLSPLFAVANASSALALFEITGGAGNAQNQSLRPISFLTLVTEAAAIYQLRQIELRWTEAGRASGLYRSRYDLLYRTGLITLGKSIGLLIRAAELLGWRAAGRFRTFASLATLATGFALPAIMLLQGNRSADTAKDYFEYTSSPPVERIASRVPALRKDPAGPPRKLGVMKWLAVAGIAVGIISLAMKPKNAY